MVSVSSMTTAPGGLVVPFRGSQPLPSLGNLGSGTVENPT
jgi:hypothetical protein